MWCWGGRFIEQIVTFDRENSLALSGLNYPQDHLSHVQVKKGMEKVPVEISLKTYDGPEQRFCPAHVYEYRKREGGTTELCINHENCLHCKTCVVKTPKEFIQWSVPGSGGPNYSNM